MFRITLVVALACCLWVGPRVSLAQRTTSGGTFGSRTLGGGVSGSSATNRNQGLTQTGQINSSAAIQRQAGSFVGADSGDSNNFRSLSGGNAAGRGGAGNFGSGLGGFGGQGGFGSGGQFGRQGQQGFGQANQGAGINGSTRTLRTPIRLGFAPPASIATRVANKMQTRFTKIPQLAMKSGTTIAVKMEGRTAVLQGAVASEHQRRLASRLALFEAGVSDVRNELTIDPSLALPEKLPPPS